VRHHPERQHAARDGGVGQRFAQRAGARKAPTTISSLASPPPMPPTATSAAPSPSAIAAPISAIPSSRTPPSPAMATAAPNAGSVSRLGMRRRADVGERGGEHGGGEQ
jgi:hypothetical protein